MGLWEAEGLLLEVPLQLLLLLLVLLLGMLLLLLLLLVLLIGTLVLPVGVPVGLSEARGRLFAELAVPGELGELLALLPDEVLSTDDKAYTWELHVVIKSTKTDILQHSVIIGLELGSGFVDEVGWGWAGEARVWKMKREKEARAEKRGGLVRGR